MLILVEYPAVSENILNSLLVFRSFKFNFLLKRIQLFCCSFIELELLRLQFVLILCPKCLIIEFICFDKITRVRIVYVWNVFLNSLVCSHFLMAISQWTFINVCDVSFNLVGFTPDFNICMN